MLSDDFFKDLVAKGKSLDVEGMFRDLLGLDKESAPADAKPASDQAREALRELRSLTTDVTDDEILTRALMVYLAIVKHSKAGGAVKFVSSEKTLKVRLRT
jgi:hypothetical protein